LRNFLASVIDPSVEIILAQGNRTPEPTGTDFIVITPLRIERLETNVDSDADVLFTGSISGTTLTVTALNFGAIAVGATVFGVGVLPGTIIRSFLSGTGGVGTYTVYPGQSVGSEELSSGATVLQQNSKVTMQVDFHSANGTDSGDQAMAVSTAFRDEYAVDQFANQTPNYPIYPLYADDPKQAPFINDQQQYEYRWMLEAVLQVNQVLVIPTQYMDAANVDLINVPAMYPP
jgi:hypothetical protein